MKKVELLAPAGSLEKLKVAVNFGADAVYVGGPRLNLRVFADNFDFEELQEGVNYAHERNVKVYLVLNAIPRNFDMKGLDEYVKKCESLGVDGVIAADPGVIAIIKKNTNLDIHLSTQANAMNYETARFWYDYGLRRIILARELKLKEIQDFRKNLPDDCEIEVFVHGAMCMAYSGRCLISNYMTSRDSNKGACSQACRYKYYLVEEKRPNEYYPVYEDESGTYIMNAKDLCMIEHIDDVIKSGVSSVKIEGRMKSVFYLAMVVKMYREAIDAYYADPENFKVNPDWRKNLGKISHRRYSTGFFYGSNGEQSYESSTYVREYEIVGIVRDYNEETKTATIEQRNRVFNGDVVEIIRPKTENFEVTLTNMKNDKGVDIEKANHAQMIFTATTERELKKDDLIIMKKNELNLSK